MCLLYVVDPRVSIPCANNGNCTAIGSLNYTCERAPSYTGPACDEEIDGCLATVCPNNSTCVCLPGFQLNGEMCVELPTVGLPLEKLKLKDSPR